jgi:hypothetical protein
MFGNISNDYTEYIKDKYNNKLGNIKLVHTNNIENLNDQNYLIINGILVKVITSMDDFKLKDIGNTKMKCLHKINTNCYIESKFIMHLINKIITNDMTKEITNRFYKNIISGLDTTEYISIYKKKNKLIYNSLHFNKGTNKTILIKSSLLDTNPKLKALNESIEIDKYIDYDNVVDH